MQACRLHSYRFLLFREISVSMYQWNLFKHQSTYKPQILLPWNKQLPCFPISKHSSRLFSFVSLHDRSWVHLGSGFSPTEGPAHWYLVYITSRRPCASTCWISINFLWQKVTWEVLHEVKAFYILLLLMLFLCVSKWYHYHLRDEVVNEQFLVEEIYERELALAEEYKREKWSDSGLHQWA